MRGCSSEAGGCGSKCGSGEPLLSLTLGSATSGQPFDYEEAVEAVGEHEDSGEWGSAGGEGDDAEAEAARAVAAMLNPYGDR